MVLYYRHKKTGDILVLRTDAKRFAQIPALLYAPDGSRARRRILTSREAIAKNYARVRANEVPKEIRA